MKSHRSIVMLLALAWVALASGTAVAQHVTLPLDVTGTLDGTVYKIRVPQNWNGTLLVFAHGTQLGTPTAETAPVAASSSKRPNRNRRAMAFLLPDTTSFSGAGIIAPSAQVALFQQPGHSEVPPIITAPALRTARGRRRTLAGQERRAI